MDCSMLYLMKRGAVLESWAHLATSCWDGRTEKQCHGGTCYLHILHIYINIYIYIYVYILHMQYLNHVTIYVFNMMYIDIYSCKYEEKWFPDTCLKPAQGTPVGLGSLPKCRSRLLTWPLDDMAKNGYGPEVPEVHFDSEKYVYVYIYMCVYIHMFEAS